MARSHTTQNLFDKKHDTFPFTGIYERVFGRPEKCGAWIIQGEEKNGKTWFSVKLAEYLSGFEKTLYISAEEGTSKGFVDVLRRAKIDHTNKNLQWLPFISIEELDEKLQSRKAPKVIFLDNTTIYADEIRANELKAFLRKHQNKLFVFVAHEEKGALYTALAVRVRKLAEIITQVKGLTAFVSGRCPGGIVTIDEEKAALYWGTEITQQNT